MSKTKTGRNQFHSRVGIAVVLIAHLMLLTACDGGIFGTGDGQVIEADSTVAIPDPEVPGMETPAQPTETSTTTNISFSNNTPVTDRTDAILRIIQANSTEQDNIVVTRNGNNDQPLLALPGLSVLEGLSALISIPAATDHQIRFFTSEDFRAGAENPIAVVNPLSTAAGTITTFLLRGVDNNSATPFQILPLVTETATTNDNSRIRVIHAASSFSVTEPIDIYLLINDQGPSDTRPLVSSLSYSDAPISDYSEIAPSLYRVVITLAGEKAPIIELKNVLRIDSDQVLTIVIRDDSQGISEQFIETLLIEDSQFPPE